MDGMGGRLSQVLGSLRAPLVLIRPNFGLHSIKTTFDIGKVKKKEMVIEISEEAEVWSKNWESNLIPLVVH